jgi:hypothetical protein
MASALLSKGSFTNQRGQPMLKKLKTVGPILPARLVLLALLAFGIGVAHATEQKVETFALSWLPPSTSYLPFYRGPLTRYRGSGPTSDVKSLLNPKLVSESYEPVARRYDRLRQSVLGKTDLLEPKMEKNLYSDELTLLNGAWQGVCDQWAGWTSSDRELIEFTNQMTDLACNGTFLSVPEVRELITSMYVANTPLEMDPEVKDWFCRTTIRT